MLTNVIFSFATPTQMAVNQIGIPPLVPNPPPVANPLPATNPATLPTLITFNHFNPLKLTPGNYNHGFRKLFPISKGVIYSDMWMELIVLHLRLWSLQQMVLSLSV